MPDITMCSSKKCKDRFECYRHTAYPNPHGQSYFMAEVYIDKTKKCDYFASNKGERNRTKEELLKMQEIYERSQHNKPGFRNF